jgi:hypothetical protein
MTSTERQEIIRGHQEASWKQQFEDNKKAFQKTELANKRRHRKQQHLKSNKQHQKRRQQTSLYTIIEKENNDDSNVQDTTGTKQTVQTKEEDESS